MNFRDAPRINSRGTLELLAGGGEVSAQLHELHAGPLQLDVNRFETGEFVMAEAMHRMLMMGLIGLSLRRRRQA